jgi:hypothetical protein
MTSNWTRSILLATAAASLLALIPAGIRAQEGACVVEDQSTGVATQGDYGCRPWEYGDPALFYNFYVPNNCGGVPAQLYIAPRPVPPVVGHTYYTYQPFMPHEFTYPHYRTYRRYYDEGHGMTRAKAVWYWNPLVETLKGVRQAVYIPR